MPATDVDEKQRREAWQLQRMIELGLEEWEASRLVQAGVDWHDVAELLEHGASRELALEILA